MKWRELCEALFGPEHGIREDDDLLRGSVALAGQAIDVARVGRPAGIQREVSLEVLESRHETTVERDAQLFELRQQLLLGVEFGLGQPRDEIAAHFGSLALLRATPDTRLAQSTRGMQRQATRPQVAQQAASHEVVDDAEPARRELFDQRAYGARRRGRSPRRFDCVRRLLRACGFDRRLTAFCFGGHNMVPRHRGEPQRQA